jgi:thiol:disulfide interchange protein DsbD
VRAEWRIADGYYLYRSKIRFTLDGAGNSPGVTLGEPVFPAGQIKDDEFFGRVEIYHGKLTIQLPVTRTGSGPLALSLVAHSQGCAEAGICYPPHRQSVKLTLPATKATAPAAASTPARSGTLAKLLPSLGAASDDEPLPPDQAFSLSAELEGDNVVARWAIAPAHYLYRDKFTFKVKDGKGVTLGQAVMPAGEEKNDEFFGRIRVFHDQVEIRVPVQRTGSAAQKLAIEIGYQGCAEAGICYPPLRKTVQLAAAAISAAPASAPPVVVAPAVIGPVDTATPLPAAEVALPAAAEPLSQQDSLAASLAGGDKLATVFTFFGLGLLLAFTPCVFPMIPILSSIIVGQGTQLTTRRAFILSVAYVLAMAVTYSIAGVIAGLFGSNLQAAFQNPWILGSFAAVFVALAFSMFGFFELQLPSALQSRITEISNKQHGGSVVGVAVMGMLSALIVGPCVAPPLMGALIYIGQTGDAVLGGVALFALSLGMGAPLLAVGVSAGKFLPRAGGWMDAVKAVFGVLLLAVAVWMLERILPAAVVMVLWALLLVVPAIYMGAIEPLGDKASGWRKLWKGLGVVLLLYGALLLVGVASGGRDPLAPMAHLRVAGGAAAPAEHLNFTRIKSEADLERELAAAKAAGKPVMLDFYADWCVSCKEFEKYTFSDAGVQQALTGAVLLQADVTANDDADQALLKRFKLIGPPAILFYDTSGAERSSQRVVGFMDAAEFRGQIAKAFK